MKVIKFQNDIHFLLLKFIEFQVCANVLEQIENLSENCNALINETSALSNEFWPWPLFEESFEDLKLDYFFILKMVKDVPFERNYYFC